jgi:6-phosphogluconolactonase
MDMSSGAMEFVGSYPGLDNPFFLAVHPQRSHLYAVNEVQEFGGQPSGAVSAFSIDPETGELSPLNQRSSGGTSPCHLSVDRSGRVVLVANYDGGTVSVLPIRNDGSLAEASHVVQHQGSSVDPWKQEGPHPHSIIVDAANRYVFASDLGLDRIMVYRLEVSGGKLTPNDKPWVTVKAGAGPRHFALHPSARYAYVINELDSTITAFAYDAATGALIEVQTVPTVPGDFDGTNHCADIHVSPDGRFVYGSNRGHDSIAIFAVDGDTGRLSHVDHEPTMGKTPCNFAIDPSGTFLLAGNQASDTIVTFRIDGATGRLEPTGYLAEVAAPVCLKLIPAPR